MAGTVVAVAYSCLYQIAKLFCLQSFFVYTIGFEHILKSSPEGACSFKLYLLVLNCIKLSLLMLHGRGATAV